MIRVPPGRAGHSWLRHRLDTATHAAALLEQKLHNLQQEEQRLAQQAQATGRQWRQHAHEADTWLLHALLTGGQRSLRLAVAHQRATVDVTWTTRMGARYPTDATCHLPAPPTPSGHVDGNAAILHARAAHQTALQAAVAHAAAVAAVHAVRAELATTRQRLRALSQRWLPQLHRALHELELTLEEHERAEDIARRRALDSEAKTR